jgi:hypothetical protein
MRAAEELEIGIREIRNHVDAFLISDDRKDLDFLPIMESAGFVRKYGAAWTASPQPRAASKPTSGREPQDSKAMAVRRPATPAPMTSTSVKRCALAFGANGVR